MEKVIIVEHCLGKDYKITTVDGTERNKINTYTVEDYSNIEVANRIIKRVENENFNKIYIDANGINIALIDILVEKFIDLNYNYNPKTGDVSKKGVITLSGNITNTGGVFTGTLSSKEDF